MNTVCTLYDSLAALLAYPSPGYRRRLAECEAVLADHHAEASGLLQRFSEGIAGLGLGDLEELFTQTFDLDPACSLEVGWHLFGENYTRGEFLVKMRKQLRRHRLPESTELPDHLTHVLSAVSRMEPGEADRFTMDHVLPALEKMLTALRGKDSPYVHVLEAIRAVLLSPYGAVMSNPACV